MYIHSQELSVSVLVKEIFTFSINYLLVALQMFWVSEVVNFHCIFASDSCLQMLAMLHLEPDVFKYYYLNQSGCTNVFSMDDDKQFFNTLVSFSTVYLYTVHVFPELN